MVEVKEAEIALERGSPEKLLQKMKRTKSNRYNFANRLKSKAEIKSHTINMLSLISIVASIYLLAYADHISGDSARLFGVLVAGVSVVSLILSLQDPVSELARRAGDAHRCAREVSNLYGELQQSTIDATLARKKYEEILNTYENHADIDNWKTLYERKADFPKDSANIGWGKGVVAYWASTYSTPFWATAMVAGVLAIWFALPVAENYFATRAAVAAESASGAQN